MQDNPLRYAQRISELLAEVPYATADAALKIARSLLDYSVTAVAQDYRAHLADQEVEVPESRI